MARRTTLLLCGGTTAVLLLALLFAGCWLASFLRPEPYPLPNDFDIMKVNLWTEAEVIKRFGNPGERSVYPKGEVWVGHSTPPGEDCELASYSGFAGATWDETHHTRTWRNRRNWLRIGVDKDGDVIMYDYGRRNVCPPLLDNMFKRLGL